MLLRVVHETHYDYTPAVKTAQHMAHLRPRNDNQQQVLSHRLGITPAPVQQSEATDVYGNTRTFFNLAGAHDALTVLADSVVSTAEQQEPTASLPWDVVRERMRYHRSAAWDPASEFVFASPYVPRDERFVAYARPSFPAGRPLWHAARELMTRIHDDFTYETDATDVGTPALEALDMRQGVCQDFAHVMLGCLRSMGLPARYVSGYLLTQPPPGKPRLIGSDASHAWVSVYLPAGNAGPGAWAELDPTNDRMPGDDYVRLAVGRDYADVSPIRGVIHGGAHHILDVAVTVSPVDAANEAANVL